MSDKCTLCAQLREVGEVPACIRNCSGSALYYGDINDPDSEVSRLLAGVDPAHIHTLRDFGNGPTVRYILRNAQWKDVMPQDCIEHSVWKKGVSKA